MLSLYLYRLALYVAFPIILLRLLWRALREPRYFEKLPQRLGLGFRAVRPNAGGVWIHAVSVGEVNAAAPLIEYLLKHDPKKPIIVTTMTPTGAERVKTTFAERVQHCYLPYDYPGAVRRFLNHASPCLAIVMETEIWPNFIAGCNRLSIPLLYVNVRLSERSYRGYQRFSSLIKPTLEKINRFAVQNEADAQRLIRLGAPAAAVTVTGSIKFDIELKPEVIKSAQALRNEWGQARLIWVVGSTHEGEEATILKTFAQLRTEFKSLLLVIAPRHPQRFATVFRLCARDYQTVLRSQTTGSLGEEVDIYIADTIGDLPMLIAAGDVAFIGGSLMPIGGHNVLEASAAEVPVVFGKHMFNFSEIAELLLQNDAAIQVMNDKELTEAMQRLLASQSLREKYAKRGKDIVAKNSGALEKICELIKGELSG